MAGAPIERRRRTVQAFGRRAGLAVLRRHWRALLAVLIAVLLGLVGYRERHEIVDVLETVNNASRGWLAVALVVQVLVYLNFAAVYWRSLALLGHHVKLLSLYGIAFVAIFLGRVFPAGGTSTYAFLLYQLRRRGVPDGTGAVTVTLDGLSYLFAFFALLLGGFVYLFTHGELRVKQILIIVLLVLAIMFLIMYLWVLHYDRPLLTRRAVVLKNGIARLLRRSWGDTGLLAFIAEIYDGLALIKRNRTGFFQLVGLQFVALFLDSLTLMCLFWALGVWPHLSVVLLGYSLAYFFSTITSLPGGAGSFEATMALTFTQLDINSEIALSVTLLYRLLAFWLPLVITALLYHFIHARPARDSPAFVPRPPAQGGG